MKQLKKHIEAAREDYASERFPGDLGTMVVERPASFWNRKTFAVFAIAASVAIVVGASFLQSMPKLSPDRPTEMQLADTPSVKPNIQRSTRRKVVLAVMPKNRKPLSVTGWGPSRSKKTAGRSWIALSRRTRDFKQPKQPRSQPAALVAPIAPKPMVAATKKQTKPINTKVTRWRRDLRLERLGSGLSLAKTT